MFRNLFKLSAILQLITAAFHALSFFSESLADNDTEKTLFDLMKNYQRDLGMGFKQSTDDLFLSMSICFTLLCLFAGLVNLFLLKKTEDKILLGGLLNINILIFGSLFFAMAFLTFLPPIICTALIFLGLIAAKFYLNKSGRLDTVNNPR